MTAKDLRSLLTRKDSSLTNLVSRAAAMQSIHAHATGVLPESLKTHVFDAVINDNNQLVILATSPAWAARLRFHSGDMLGAVRREGIPATQCLIKVRPQAKTGDG
ncbi:MAG: DciA family protein [Woeseiaceae bacterium]